MDRIVKLKSAVEAAWTACKTWLGLDYPQLYRPEAHYMRGPGPKWRAMHGEPKRAVVRAGHRAATR